MALEEKSLLLHDPEDALMVGRWLALCGPQSVDQGGDAPIAVGGSFIDHPPDQRQELLIGRFAVVAAWCCRPMNTLVQMRAGHAKHVGDRLHWEASFSSDTCCKVGFFAWDGEPSIDLGMTRTFAFLVGCAALVSGALPACAGGLGWKVYSH